MELVDKNNTYTIPAEIEVFSGSDEGYNERIEFWREYIIKCAYFDDGQKIEFEDSRLTLNSRTSITSIDGREWKCTLLNKHAYSNYIKETTYSNNARIVIEAILYPLVILMFLAMCIHGGKYKDEEEK